MTAREIKEYGLSIGYSKVGITTMDHLSGFADEVLSRGGEYEGLFRYTSTNPVQGAALSGSMPGAKSVIVMIFDYFQKEFPEALKKMIGKAYLGRCYNPISGTLNHARLELMKVFLSQNGLKVKDDIGIPARWAAAQAGIVTFGRNNFVYGEDTGSYVIISTLVVDQALECDTPTMESKCPDNCNVCIRACPTQALYAPYRLDPRKCIGFHNWMTQDGRAPFSSFIPYEIRESIGCRIHGCDVCQDVCPRNQKKLKQPKPMDRYLEEIAPDITLPAILNMTDDYYRSRIRPVMFNYIREKRYFIRNAAIAMGNLKDAAYVDDLALALETPDEMIRMYVVWALGKIGGDHAKTILENRKSMEASKQVKQAIADALACA